MRYKYFLLIGVLMVGLAIVLAACGQPTVEATPCPTAPACPECPAPPEPEPCPTCPEAPACPEPLIADENLPPIALGWIDSPHNDSTAEAFNHWNEDDPQEIPVTCAKCHSTPGFQDYVGADGSEVGVVDAPAPIGTTINCSTCHNEGTANLSTVVFPSGAEVTGLGSEAICMTCHQGNASKVQVDQATADMDPDAVNADLGFINIHYFAAAATLYGTVSKGGYEYDGQMYDYKNDHTAAYDTCIECHNVHTLEVKVEECAVCHEGVTSVEDLQKVRMIASASDYDGDGDVTESIASEVAGLQEKLLSGIQAYASEVAGTPIVYSPAAYPYFFIDTNNNGTTEEDEAQFANLFASWTPRLLKAAYNYQTSIKDPGAFAHGNKYIIQLLFDSVQDLNTSLSTPIDMSVAVRDDAGHFAGNTLPFRDWDADGEVPYRCVKCHTATGLPEFIHNGGTVVFDSRGTTLTAGVGAMLPNNGFACSTCHDEANWPNRYAVTSVPFPSGASITFSQPDAEGNLQPNDSNLCIECHQGRESTNSVNAALRGKDPDTVDDKISFKNIHYFAAGATLFGSEAKGAYLYEGKDYLGVNNHPVIECKGCHDVHKLEPKVDTCATCHTGVTDPTTIRMSTIDYDGDGDTTEGIKGEMDTLAEALYAAMQAYATEVSGVGIVYDTNSYPYFFVDADGDGEADLGENGSPIRFSAFTPRLMEAAYNYQYSQKDPGAYVHNGDFVIQFLIDSIEDLGGDVTTYTRPETPSE